MMREISVERADNCVWMNDKGDGEPVSIHLDLAQAKHMAAALCAIVDNPGRTPIVIWPRPPAPPPPNRA